MNVNSFEITGFQPYYERLFYTWIYCMLSSKAKILWIKWHAYVSCFFLPLALLFVFTGVLYLFDIEGGDSAHNEYIVKTELKFPIKETQAEEFALKIIELHNIEISSGLALPENYYRYLDDQGWWDLHQELTLSPLPEQNAVKVIVKYSDLWHQFVYIHKGLAGDIFYVLSILFGISLFFSLLSGSIVALVMPKLKKNAALSMGAGFLTLVIAYFLS